MYLAQLLFVGDRDGGLTIFHIMSASSADLEPFIDLPRAHGAQTVTAILVILVIFKK